MIDPASLTRIAMDPAMLGAEVVARAYGVADDASNPPRVALAAKGESLRAMSPCHFAVVVDAVAFVLSWVARRRAAVGWSMSSGDDAAAAGFQVTVRRGSGELVRVTSTPMLSIPGADIAALGTGPIRFEVTEQGDLPSRPSIITLAA